MVAENHPLALAGEDDAVIADDRAAAQRGEADVALAARAGQAVAAARRMVFERNASRRGRRFAKQERCARGRVDLHPMMHLDDLDVEIGPQRQRRAPGQRRKQVDAEAHVARPHNRGVARRRVDLVEIVGAEAGCADHVDDARLRGEPGELDARGGRGEIDDRVSFEQKPQRVGDDRKAARRAARQHGRIGAKPRRIRRSSAPVSSSPSDSWIVLTTMRPMRPAAPLTISLIAAIQSPASSARRQAVVTFGDDEVHRRRGVAQFRRGAIFLGLRGRRARSRSRETR